MRILVLFLLIVALNLGQTVAGVSLKGTPSHPSQQKSIKSKSKAKTSKAAKSNKQKQRSRDESKSSKVNKSKSKRQGPKASKSTQAKSKTQSRVREKEPKLDRSKARRQRSISALAPKASNNTPADGKRASSDTSDATTSSLDSVAQASSSELSPTRQKVAKQAPIIIQGALMAADQTTMLKLLKPDGLEVNLMSNRGRYLPKEATKLLSLFYQQYTPTSLKWVHKGRTKSGLYYLLGKLQCLTGISPAKPSNPKPEAKTTEVALYLVYRIKNSQVMIQNLELDR